MTASNSKLLLRPGITNPSLWYPDRPPGTAWNRIRTVVMERDDWTCAGCGHRARKWMHTHHLTDSADNSPDNLVPVCVACHAVLHVGRSLVEAIVEVWQCELSQVEIVQRTRAGIRQGCTLAAIKQRLLLTPGPYPPDAVQYANDLVATMGNAPRASLDAPLSAVFVNLSRWQLDA